MTFLMGAAVGHRVSAGRSQGSHPPPPRRSGPCAARPLLNSASWQQWTASNRSGTREVSAAGGHALQKINSGHSYCTVQSRGMQWGQISPQSEQGASY